MEDFLKKVFEKELKENSFHTIVDQISVGSKKRSKFLFEKLTTHLKNWIIQKPIKADGIKVKSGMLRPITLFYYIMEAIKADKFIPLPKSDYKILEKFYKIAAHYSGGHTLDFKALLIIYVTNVIFFNHRNLGGFHLLVKDVTDTITKNNLQNLLRFISESVNSINVVHVHNTINNCATIITPQYRVRTHTDNVVGLMHELNQFGLLYEVTTDSIKELWSKVLCLIDYNTFKVQRGGINYYLTHFNLT